LEAQGEANLAEEQPAESERAMQVEVEAEVTAEEANEEGNATHAGQNEQQQEMVPDTPN